MNKQKNYGWAGIVAGVLLAIWMVANSLNPVSIVVGGQTIPQETQEIDFKGITGIATAQKFGTLVSGTGVNPGTFDWDVNLFGDYSICGDNDGKITINNLINSDNTLSFTSSSSESGKGCSNNINADLIIPKGTLTVRCDLTATDSRDFGANAFCNLNNYFNEGVSSRGKPPNFEIDGGTKTKSIVRTINFDKTTNVKLSVGGFVGISGGGGSSYSSRIVLDFTPFVETISVYELINNECQQTHIPSNNRAINHFDTLIECEDNIAKTFYRLVDNQCQEVSLIQSEKTEIDFETLIECEESKTSFTNIFLIIGLIVLFIIGLVIILIKK